PSVLNDRPRHGAVVLGRMEFDASLIQRLAFERDGAGNPEPRITRTAAGNQRGYESHQGELPQELHESPSVRMLPTVSDRLCAINPDSEEIGAWDAPALMDPQLRPRSPRGPGRSRPFERRDGARRLPSQLGERPVPRVAPRADDACVREAKLVPSCRRWLRG